MNGFENSTCDMLVGFQVKGKNQLFKEIEEIKFNEEKFLDYGATHRNEETMEIEGEKAPSQLNSYLSMGNSARGGTTKDSARKKMEHPRDLWIEKSQEFDKNTLIDEMIIEHQDP